MKIFFVLSALLGIAAANSVCFSSEEITEELINNPQYLVTETEDGAFEVEDLYDPTIELFATESDITFYFFTPENRKSGFKIKESQLKDIVRLTGFNISRETLVVIHGWQNNRESPVNDYIKNAALRKHNINVIVADWSPIAKRNYVTAQRSVVRVGNYIGDFLIRLDNELDHRLNRITIVGHSLGAHISGNAGARTGGIIDTIIGLDPAGPLFSNRRTDNRLDPTDASYVHVIHTNDGRLGFNIKMGHADYYPNGGKSQPGCGIDLTGSCAHSRAYKYFAESLNNDNFFSKRCQSYRQFRRGRCDSNANSRMGGFPIRQTKFGEYYLTTNKRSPFARG